jgi:quinol monooxygenase YgiN
MKNLIIATFIAAEGKFETLTELLKASLPDTRAFDGCIELDVYQEEGTNTFTIVEDWSSFEHYDKYLAWRAEGGLAELLEDLLEGGYPAGFKVQKFVARTEL